MNTFLVSCAANQKICQSVNALARYRGAKQAYPDSIPRHDLGVKRSFRTPLYNTAGDTLPSGLPHQHGAPKGVRNTFVHATAKHMSSTQALPHRFSVHSSSPLQRLTPLPPTYAQSSYSLVWRGCTSATDKRRSTPNLLSTWALLNHLGKR